MRGRQRTIYLGLAFVMVLGIGIYFNLWAIDYRISVDEAESLRRQFDLANKEAMDESASWRLRYDEEAERASKCDKELIQIKESLEKNAEDAVSINKKLEMLQKDNLGLLERVEYLKQELEAEKLKCKLQ